MSLLGEATYALIAPSSRSIGMLIPDVVLEEIHRDDLIITQHPVEKGASITDHAFKRPAEIEMRCGWSNSTAGSEGYARQTYAALLALQKSRQPFSVSTGKRAYRNMLIASLGVETNSRSENALLVSVRMQEIIIVSTQTTNTGSTTAAASSTGDQANPANTASATDFGNKTATGVGDTAFAGSFNPSGFDTGNLSSEGTVEVGPITEVPDTGSITPTTPTPASPGNAPYNIFEFG